MAEFKTSFIPQKPMAHPGVETGARGINLILFVSLVLFFATVIIAGGVFLYGALLQQQEEGLATSIERARQAIEPELVASLGRIDARIKATEEILDSHTVLAPVFRLLEQLTLSSISFESFRYVIEPNGKVILQLSGVARNYSSVALQSVIFGENRFIENPIFSNLRLNNLGNVTFNFSTNINRRFILHENNIVGASPSNF